MSRKLRNEKLIVHLSPAAYNLYVLLDEFLGNRTGAVITHDIMAEYAKAYDIDLTRSTYYRGLKELLENHFLAKSTTRIHYYTKKSSFNSNRLIMFVHKK